MKEIWKEETKTCLNEEPLQPCFIYSWRKQFYSIDCTPYVQYVSFSSSTVCVC